jgi:hypothetical protein
VITLARVSGSSPDSLAGRFPAASRERHGPALTSGPARDQDTGEQGHARGREDHPALPGDRHLFFHFAGGGPEPPGGLARLRPRPGHDVGLGGEGCDGLADVFPS